MHSMDLHVRMEVSMQRGKGKIKKESHGMSAGGIIEGGEIQGKGVKCDLRTHI